MKNATRSQLSRLLTLALAAAAIAWIPPEKGKRKLRMALLDQPLAGQVL
jgi:hypothetical protein